MNEARAATAGPPTRRPPTRSVRPFTVNRTATRTTITEARAALAAYLERQGIAGTILSERRFRDGWSFLVELERGTQA